VNKNKKIVIAIDGPAASGKSTTARKVAQKLGYLYIDSGAMYRAVTLKALRQNVDVSNFKNVSEIARWIDIKFKKNAQKTVILLDEEDVSEAIRSPEIDQNISPVAANSEVRQILVTKQKQLGKNGGVVMDGRDIGTVVFPDAELKIYMVAGVEERAKRRQKEQLDKGKAVNIDTIMEDIQYRDAQDLNRKFGPLKKAENAIEIDTTHLSIEEQVEKILAFAKKILNSE
jgi:cytidylate kinase